MNSIGYSAYSTPQIPIGYPTEIAGGGPINQSDYINGPGDYDGVSPGPIDGRPDPNAPVHIDLSQPDHEINPRSGLFDDLYHNEVVGGGSAVNDLLAVLEGIGLSEVSGAQIVETLISAGFSDADIAEISSELKVADADTVNAFLTQMGVVESPELAGTSDPDTGGGGTSIGTMLGLTGLAGAGGVYAYKKRQAANLGSGAAKASGSVSTGSASAGNASARVSNALAKVGVEGAEKSSSAQKIVTGVQQSTIKASAVVKNADKLAKNRVLSALNETKASSSALNAVKGGGSKAAAAGENLIARGAKGGAGKFGRFGIAAAAGVGLLALATSGD